MVLAGSIYFPARSQQFILWVRLYLTIIPRARVGYEMIANEARSAELAIISYPTSAGGIIVLLNRPQNIEN